MFFYDLEKQPPISYTTEELFSIVQNISAV